MKFALNSNWKNKNGKHTKKTTDRKETKATCDKNGESTICGYSGTVGVCGTVNMREKLSALLLKTSRNSTVKGGKDLLRINAN